MSCVDLAWFGGKRCFCWSNMRQRRVSLDLALTKERVQEIIKQVTESDSFKVGSNNFKMGIGFGNAYIYNYIYL